MSASMVDLVAQALCANAQGYVDAKWYDYTPAARAAIEAMREPTEAMIEAPNERERALFITPLDKAANPSLRLHYSVAYRAMIDKALSE